MYTPRYMPARYLLLHARPDNAQAVMENCLGQAYFVGGGVQVMTASLINEYSGIVAYTGSGELTVLAGVSILTGIGNQEGFGIGTSIGIGMEYTVGPAVVVHTGASMQVRQTHRDGFVKPTTTI